MLKELLQSKAKELGLKIGFTSKTEYEKHKTLRDYLQFTESIISVAMPITRNDNQIMASFALEEDYHFVLRRKINALLDILNNHQNEFYVDNGPVDDVLCAYLAGVGFVGKHSIIITNDGSYHMLGEILTSAIIEVDYPTKVNCGTCNLCEIACPTKAIPGNVYEQCLVGFLQRKIVLPDDIYSKFETIYGCDICQQVCPFNKKVQEEANQEYINIDIIDILTASKRVFKEKFYNTAFYWLGHNVMKRNVIIYAANKSIDIDEYLIDVNSKEDYMLSAIDYYMRKKEEQ